MNFIIKQNLYVLKDNNKYNYVNKILLIEYLN
jgi:hypothetical protein